MSVVILPVNIEKVYTFLWDGRRRFFIFSHDGKTCLFGKHEKNKYTLRKAKPEDWMFIGGENSKGFIDCDFRGCDFSNFDITGTNFLRCKFDCGAFDYSYTSYENMTDCIFTTPGVKLR